MAKIVHSDTAPAETVHYSFAGGEFDLGGRSKRFETDDAGLIAGAEAHPWLTVEYDVVEPIQGAYREQLLPEEDAMSAVNSIANDPEEARKAEQAKMEQTDNPVAVDAGETQTEVVTTSEVAETLAADPTSKTAKKGDS